ncbi:MAG TPA: peptidyl-prolyl cis-trans isomerase [Solirubrobacterales bacterium]
MSPDEGRKGTGKGGDGAAAPFASRRALLAFGILFVVLFAVVAIAEGLGDPSVPSGDAALVEDAPGDTGKVTEAEVDHAIELAAASQEGAQKAPKPGDPKYEELKEAAMQSILEGVWIRGLADEEGIEVTEREVDRQVRKVKNESFQSEAEFQKFLKESGFTPTDVDSRIEVELLSEQLQEQLAEEAPKPSEREIEDYYEAAKATQFTTQPSVDVRLIVNKDEQKAEEAKKALVDDNTAKNWSKVAKEFSEDVATKEKGGLQKGLQEGVSEEPLDAEFFDTPEGQVEGPLDSQRGYTVFEVVNSTPESAQELKVAEPQIKSTLEQRLEQEFFENFVSNFNAEWRSRTFCASDYVTERCANFKPSGPPASTPKACYEEDPKGGLPEACPAPVFQLIPALPGSVTPLEPQGKPLAQRPLPGEEAGGAPEAPTGLPEGVPPPETAPEEAPSE